MAVTNTDSDNPRKEVQVSVSLVIKEPLHVPLVEQQRLREVRRVHGGEVLLVDLQDAVVGKGLWTDSISVRKVFLLLISTFLTSRHRSSALPLLTPQTAAALCSAAGEPAPCLPCRMPRPFLSSRGSYQCGPSIPSCAKHEEGTERVHLSMESLGFEFILAAKKNVESKCLKSSVGFLNKFFILLYFLE